MAMKTSARILFAVLIAAGPLAGQGWEGGIKAAALLSFTGDKDTSSIYDLSENFIGFDVGLFYARKFFSYFSVQAEVNLARKGVYCSPRSQPLYAIHFNYLEFPLLLNVRIARGVLEISVGPYAALLVSHNPVKDTHVYWTRPENELKNYDLGACFGSRVWLGDWSIELRFSPGFVNILPDYHYPERFGHRNTVLAVQVGYRLFK